MRGIYMVRKIGISLFDEGLLLRERGSASLPLQKHKRTDKIPYSISLLTVHVLAFRNGGPKHDAGMMAVVVVV